jgi:hypothetical protein
VAHLALSVAPDDPFVLATAAYALAFFGEDIDAAINLVDRALELNPSFARGWVISGSRDAPAPRPLFPRKRTLVDATAMSAKGHKAT